jgi:YD repeat-containing protein
MMTVDAQGRPTRYEVPNTTLQPIDMHYTLGRMDLVTQGGRTRTLTYSTTPGLTRGYLTKAELTGTGDPRIYSTTFLPDGWGRVLQSTTDSKTTQFTWDPNGNLSTVKPPGKPVHGHTYDALDGLRKYTAPVVPSPYEPETNYQRDLDGALTSVTLPNDRSTGYTHDPTTGRLQGVSMPHGTVSVEYDSGVACPVSNPGPSCKGQVTALRGPASGIDLAYTYDGPLPKSETWTNPAAGGALVGKLEWDYDDLLRLKSEKLTTPLVTSNSSFGYDADGLVTCASSSAAPCVVGGATGEGFNIQLHGVSA